MCTYLAVSKTITTALGLGIAFIVVQGITVPVNNLIFTYLLKDGALAWAGLPDVDLSFLGLKLLGALGEAKIFLPAACGGQGTCGQCRARVFEGGGDILPTETSHISKREAAGGERLACQVAVKQDMKIQVPNEVFGVRKMECTVRSNNNVSTFIKELVLKLPKGEELEFRAGGYIQIECPPHHLKYADFDIPGEYRLDWDHYKLWRYESDVKKPAIRAYSMASYPDEKDIVMLNVRIATPPPSKPDVPPGIMSSYIFSLKPEDNWEGYTGFIHEVLLNHYLSQHPTPEDCEYYLCGPPIMNAAVIKMLEDLGVEHDNIMLDDFGA